MPLTQANRLLNLNSPFKPDQLLLTGFRGTEELSRLFHFELDMIGEDVSVDSGSIVGKPVAFSIELADESRRWFHGFVREIVLSETDGSRGSYHADVVPWLWFLTQTADCRIFQKMTVPKIIEKIFQDLSFNSGEHFRVNLQNSYKEWEYCVQYRETDFNFVSRLMEQEGIFYYFEHTEDGHVLVLADDVSEWKACPESEVAYPPDHGTDAITDHITSWEHRFEFHSGAWAHTDYNFKTPLTSLMAETSSLNTGQLKRSDDYEVYDYPGEYAQKSEGSAEVRVRMEEEEVPHDVVNATSQCKTFRPAGVFSISEHHSPAEVGKSYTITSIRHSAREPFAYETGASPVGREYSNSFTCVPDNVTFRPARITPKPLVSGIQSAVVMGPPGEEIFTDEYGRVKVLFHWDREGVDHGGEKARDESSCWIRVAQNMAGRQWGFMAIPRIGQEVVVDFLEGDPDRPLVVGGVHNADQMPHYPLPDEKTKTYIKTNSTKGGDGFNELMFEDKADDERVFIHAQKNMDVRVLNDAKERIYGNEHQIVGWEKDGKKGGDKREMIWEDKHLNVKRDNVEHVEGNLQLMVGNGEADDGGQVDIVIEKNRNEKIDGDTNVVVGGAHKEKIGGASSSTIGGNWHSKSGGDVAVEAAKEIHVKAGMKLILEAGVQISLKGPGGFIDIGPAGVTIQGVMVKINSGGSAGSGSGCSPESPEEAKEAAPVEPAQAWNSKTGMKSSPD